MSTVDLEPVRGRLAHLGRTHTSVDVAEAMRASGQIVTDTAVVATVEALRRESVGAGILDPLLRLNGVTDVLVNGPRRVYVDRGEGLELTGITFASDEAVRHLAQRLAASVGRRLDESSPFVDARLQDGTRVHAVLGSLASPGTCLSLRVPARRTFSLDDCVRSGSVSAGGREVLLQVVGARLAFLISGGTGSGKTTLLAAMLGAVPAAERILIVEDSRELAPDHPHVIRLEGRPANAESAGSVTLTDLVRQSLRMRPDRLVVGEVRGAEVRDLLAAMNTGHEGGCATVHANSAADVPARLEALAALAEMSRPALHAQLASAVDVVLHIARHRRGRRLEEIHVLAVDSDSGLSRTQCALHFGPGAATTRGPGAQRLEELLG
ncbi:MAG TPA: TadA family conjugal transfer-associated ATPase [Propionibacteriaceae bacterium]|nr:TadA family conjugal transfer-associated ATPase [Propionibacteriaceae bacterium]